MNTREICRRGYFDRVVVDGYLMPMYNNKGIVIRPDETLAESLENNEQAYNQGIGKLRINIAGESLNKDTYEGIIAMQEHREKELQLKVQRIGTIDRYNIGYVDILILKSNYSFPEKVENMGKGEEDLNKLAKAEDERDLLLKALEMQRDLKQYREKDCNIAIINRIYVNKEFRGCGIASWVHNNIRDIVRVYGMIRVAAVLLTPGDFCKVASSEFNMNDEEYKKFLIKHYKKQKYKQISHGIMYKEVDMPLSPIQNVRRKIDKKKEM